MELLSDQQLCLRTFQTVYTKLSKVVARPQTLDKQKVKGKMRSWFVWPLTVSLKVPSSNRIFL